MTEPVTKIKHSEPADAAQRPLNVYFDGPAAVRKLLIACVLIEFFLVFIDATVNYGKWIDIGAIRRLCNIAREDGLATWFQVAQTLMAGITLWGIWLVSRQTGQPKKTILGWGILAAFFTFMSADDGAKIHERIGTTAGSLMGDAGVETSGSVGNRILDMFPSYNWQLVVLPVFIALGLFMLYFLWQQTPKSRHLLLAGVSCFAVAVGLDFFEGLDELHPANIYTKLQTILELSEYTVSHFAKSLEEFLEMLGISFLWSLFANHLSHFAETGFTITSRQRLP